jgi:hypothetical protein
MNHPRGTRAQTGRGAATVPGQPPRPPPASLFAAGFHNKGEESPVRSLNLETTYGVLCISTSFTWHDNFEAPSMRLTIGNDIDGHVRLHFTDPDALDQLVTAVRRLQRDCRAYHKRLQAIVNLNAAY